MWEWEARVCAKPVLYKTKARKLTGLQSWSQEDWPAFQTILWEESGELRLDLDLSLMQRGPVG